MNKNSVNKGCCKEERSGEAKAPEPEEEGQEVYLDLTSDEESRYITHETEDCGSDDVPHGTKSETGSKTIKQADLVSMWKYMLSPAYANRRLALYTYLNSLLRRGHLSSTVGFKVLNRVINKEACEFTGVSFWKVDREDFYADVRVKLTLQSLTGVRTWEGILVCWCSFDDEEKFSLSVEDLTDSVDRKAEGLIMLSPFLVPYLTGEKMDAFADEVWIRYGLPEAISNPSLRNATELARRMGLQIMYLDVYEHRNMDSIIFFADSDLVVGEDRVEKQEDGNWHRIKTGFPTTVRIPADTIVVNTNKIRKDYSAFNIFHECIHYLLHNMFYRLQDMGSNDIRLVKIKEVEIEDGKNLSDPIYFMEKQANRGAFALMMPADDTRERIREEAGKVKTYKNVGEKYEIIGKKLSYKLGYPHFRVKPRMIQLGYYETKGALNYGDNHKLIQPFAFSRDSWQESEVTFVVKESTSNMLYQRNDDFRKVMDSGEFVFADGHIVRNKPRFVKKQGDKILLTDEAAGRVDDCCLRFTRQYVQKDVGDYILGRMFYDAHYVEQTNFYLNDLINEKHLDELDAKMEYKDTFPRKFVDAFDQIMEQNNETRETVAPRLHISTDTLHRWLHEPETKITYDFVIRIALMWQIPDWISKMLLDRAMVHVSEYDRRHQALEHIRTVLWDQGIEEANKFLAGRGLELLESYDPPLPEGRKRKRKVS